mmetsp:Transcript_80576/g.261104  ORF Transcript_80576/g.261104 Transcript_80576/m.261104 type:complete len:202 (+) Transcript_80576:643-1248(+)
MPLRPPLPWCPSEAKVWPHGTLLHEEALRRNVAVSKLLLVQVEEGIQCLEEHPATPLRGKGQTAEAAVRGHGVLHQSKGLALHAIAQDPVEGLVDCAELAVECRSALKLHDGPSAGLGNGKLFLGHLRKRAALLQDVVPPSPLLLVAPHLAVQVYLHPDSRRGHLEPQGHLCVGGAGAREGTEALVVLWQGGRCGAPAPRG